MTDPRFLAAPEPVGLQRLSELVGADLNGTADREISGIAALDHAGPQDLSFLDNRAYLGLLRSTRAAAVIVAPEHAEQAPAGVSLLLSAEPYRAFAKAAALLFPAAIRPQAIFASEGVAPGAVIHPEARLEPGVVVDPGVVIGPRAQIGEGTIICANTVIGPDVSIGRGCSIGSGATLLHCMVGNRVIMHAGVRLGQDGFGFAMGAKGHLKVPQIGRVIVQDDVEIGAGTCIDRGSIRDTVIGEGSKIDNLVQIAHNVVIGRHCVIVSQVGISGSTTLGDFVVLGGQVGLAGHLTIGSGAQLAARSGVMSDVPAGGRYAGAPAQPIRDHFREIAQVRKMAAASKDRFKSPGGSSTGSEGEGL